MRQLGRGILLGLAIAGLAAVLFQFAWTVYGILDNTPIDYIWGSLLILLVCGCVYYTKWLIGVFNKARRERKWYQGANADAIEVWNRNTGETLAEGTMEDLELDVHEWSTRGDTPGSLAGSVIGLDAVDEYLEGDM